MQAAAVEVEGLCKRYGAVVGADDVSFVVGCGEVFGILGPNGAGKTTVVECLATLRHRDRGTVRVLGLDPEHAGAELRVRIGVQLQRAAVQERITVAEALHLFAAFYPRSADLVSLLRQVGLEERASVPFGKLSGGERQRLFVALALVNEPSVVFLDELSTGLDPHGRRMVWGLVHAVRERGTTVILTTHLMDEAERLCDRVAVMSRGRIVASDAPQRLIERAAGHRIVFHAETAFDVAVLARIPGVEGVDILGDRVIVHARARDVSGDVIAALSASGFQWRDFHVERPTLEDVYLQLTGDALAAED